MKINIDRVPVTIRGSACKATIRFDFKSKTAGKVRVGATIDKDYAGRCKVVDMAADGTRAEASGADDRRAKKIVNAAWKRLKKSGPFGSPRRPRQARHTARNFETLPEAIRRRRAGKEHLWEDALSCMADGGMACRHKPTADLVNKTIIPALRAEGRMGPPRGRHGHR